MNRLAALMVTVPGIFALARFAVMLWHPSIAARVIEHVGQVIGR